MLSFQCNLVENETPHRQTTAATRPELSAPGKQTSGEKQPPDPQAAMESMHAAFVWLFGSGCY